MSINNNTTFQCYNDLSAGQYKTTLFVDGVMRIIQTVGCGLALALLLLSFRKKALNSPAKRLGLSLIFAFSLSSLNRVVMEFYPYSLPAWLCIVTIILFCLGSTIILYLVVLPVVLLLQVAAPMFPEQGKRILSPAIPVIEAVVQVLIILLSILFNSAQFVDSDIYSTFCQRCITLFNYEVIALAFSVAVLFVTIFILGVFCYKFRKTDSVTKRIKWAMIKVLVLFLTIYAAFIGDAIVAASIKDHTYALSLVQSIFFTVVKLIFILALMVLVYCPSTAWCSRLCKSVTEDRSPLLLQSEKQQTRPDSVWDHANVPSYTQSIRPREMSDCETDDTI